MDGETSELDPKDQKPEKTMDKKMGNIRFTAITRKTRVVHV